MTDTAIRDAVIALSWSIRSDAALPGCVEQEYQRAAWLKALDALGLTHEQARELDRAARGVFRRARLGSR